MYFVVGICPKHELGCILVYLVVGVCGLRQTQSHQGYRDTVASSPGWGGTVLGSSSSKGYRSYSSGQCKQLESISVKTLGIICHHNEGFWDPLWQRQLKAPFQSPLGEPKASKSPHKASLVLGMIRYRQNIFYPFLSIHPQQLYNSVL